MVAAVPDLYVPPGPIASRCLQSLLNPPQPSPASLVYVYGWSALPAERGRPTAFTSADASSAKATERTADILEMAIARIQPRIPRVRMPGAAKIIDLGVPRATALYVTVHVDYLTAKKKKLKIGETGGKS